jgi:twitching motility protein PilJ
MQKFLESLQRLSLPQKLFLIVLLLSVPLVALLYSQITAAQANVARDAKELRGSVYNQAARGLLEASAQFGAGGDAAAIEEKLRVLQKLDLEAGADFATSEKLRAVSANLETLKQKGAGDPVYGIVNAGIRDLIAQATDGSGLLQDPDLEVLYTLFPATQDLPRMQDLLAQSLSLANRAITSRNLSIEDRVKLLSASNEIQSGMNTATANLEKAVKYTPLASVRPLLSQAQGLQSNTQAYLNLLNQQVLTPTQLTASSGDVINSGRQVLTQSFQLWDNTTKGMDELLEIRRSTQASRRNYLLIGALVLAALVGVIVYLVSRAIRLQLTSLNTLVSEIGKGNQDARARVYAADELGALALTFNTMLDNNQGLIQSREERDRIQTAIMKLLNEVSSVAEGDLTREAEVTADATGAIADSFNVMITELRRIIGKVQTVSNSINHSVTETQEQTTMLAEEAEAQSRHIVETSQEIGHMADTIREVANTADSSRRVAEQSLITVRAGADKVESTIQSMGHLREQVQETSKRIKRLGENAQEIGETVQLIGDIAYRTSVLALNASIQAARAGEAGRGFGVVAEEVDRLSKRSTEAARRIAELIKTAQTSTNSAIASMEENTRNVVESTLFLQEAGHSLHNLESVTGKLAEMIGSISTLTERQNQQSSAVAQTMLDISHATQLTANGIKRSSNTVNQLAELADDLQGSVAAFRINKQAAHVTRALNGKAKAVAKA